MGEYTAAAVASIAFHERVAAVDGNVARIMARLFGVTDDILSPVGKRRVQHIAASLLPPRRCGDFNQAWMDLGSMICTPKSPRCSQCPLAFHCVAAANDQTDKFPLRGTNWNKRREIPLLTAIFVHNGRMLVSRRPRGGLWSGLWEFPTVEIPAPRDVDSKRAAGLSLRGREVRRWLRRLAEKERLTFEAKPEPAGPVYHQLTHRSLTFHIYVVPVKTRDGGEAEDRRWVTARGFARLSVSTAHRRVYANAKALTVH